MNIIGSVELCMFRALHKSSTFVFYMPTDFLWINCSFCTRFS